jgi:hypothetical protein
MPERETLERARRDKLRGKSASSQAGEFVREQIHKVRERKHGARSAKQAIAIGLSMARRAGVDLPPPRKGKAPERTRRAARLAYDAGHGHPHGTSSPRRSRATERALKREGHAAASHLALSRQARAAARSRTAAERSQAAKDAARTKGVAGRSAAARKAARTRAHGR